MKTVVFPEYNNKGESTVDTRLELHQQRPLNTATTRLLSFSILQRLLLFQCIVLGL